MCTILIVLTLAATLYVTCYTFFAYLHSFHISPSLALHKNYRISIHGTCVCLSNALQMWKCSFSKENERNRHKVEEKNMTFSVFCPFLLCSHFCSTLPISTKCFCGAAKHILTFMVRFGNESKMKSNKRVHCTLYAAVNSYWMTLEGEKNPVYWQLLIWLRTNIKKKKNSANKEWRTRESHFFVTHFFYIFLFCPI